MDFNLNTLIDTYTTEIIGGLLTAIILLSFGFIKDFIKNLKIRKAYSGYIGKYYLYNFTSAGIDTITTTKLSIQPKLGKLIAYANNENIYHYVGEMTISERNLYITYDGVSHLEKLQLVFYSPLHRKIKNLVGVLSAVSIIGEPFACVCILSDKALSDDEVKEEFKKNGYTQKKSILKISQNNSIFYDNITSL